VSTSETWSNSNLTSGSFGTVEPNTTYTASIAYDGDNSFILVFDNGDARVVDGPPRVGAAFGPERHLDNRVRLGQDNRSDDFSDSLPDVHSPASIAGTVD
jgi:hypothetical protein